MDVVGVETAELKIEDRGEGALLLDRLRATSKARQRASLLCSAERRSSTSSLRAESSSGEERQRRFYQMAHI